MHLIKGLGFGFADVVVAVSRYWIDVSTMADLDDVCAAYAAEPSPASARGDQIRPADPQLLRPGQNFGLPHCAQRGRHRRRAGGGHGGSDRGHHHHGRDPARQWAENSGRRRDLKSQAQLAASLTADWNADARKACEALLSRLEPSGVPQAQLAQAFFQQRHVGQASMAARASRAVLEQRCVAAGRRQFFPQSVQPY